MLYAGRLYTKTIYFLAKQARKEDKKEEKRTFCERCVNFRQKICFSKMRSV